MRVNRRSEDGDAQPLNCENEGGGVLSNYRRFRFYRSLRFKPNPVPRAPLCLRHGQSGAGAEVVSLKLEVKARFSGELSDSRAPSNVHPSCKGLHGEGTAYQ